MQKPSFFATYRCVLSSRYIFDRYLPDKAIDLIDEAAAKLRIENDSMPKEIKDLRDSISNIKDQEHAASSRNDYEIAANLKTEHIRINEKFSNLLNEWQSEHEVSDTVRDKDIKYLNKTFNDFKSQLVEFSKVYFPETHNDFSDASSD